MKARLIVLPTRRPARRTRSGNQPSYLTSEPTRTALSTPHGSCSPITSDEAPGLLGFHPPQTCPFCPDPFLSHQIPWSITDSNTSSLQAFQSLQEGPVKQTHYKNTLQI